MCGLEFTLPPKVQRLVKDSDLPELRRLAWETINDMFNPVDENGKRRYELGGVFSYHFWHSEDPFGGWFQHVHCSVSDMAL